MTYTSRSFVSRAFLVSALVASCGGSGGSVGDAADAANDWIGSGDGGGSDGSVPNSANTMTYRWLRAWWRQGMFVLEEAMLHAAHESIFTCH